MVSCRLHLVAGLLSSYRTRAALVTKTPAHIPSYLQTSRPGYAIRNICALTKTGEHFSPPSAVLPPSADESCPCCGPSSASARRVGVCLNHPSLPEQQKVCSRCDRGRWLPILVHSFLISEMHSNVLSALTFSHSAWYVCCWMRLTFKYQLTLSRANCPHRWVSPNQSVEGLNKTKTDSPWAKTNSACRQPLDLNYTISFPGFSASWPGSSYRFFILLASIISWTNSLKSIYLSIYLSSIIYLICHLFNVYLSVSICNLYT